MPPVFHVEGLVEGPSPRVQGHQPPVHMPASVHAGNLGRWFEVLCRINHPQLRAVTTEAGTALRPNQLPSEGGVYCFWWTGNDQELKAADCVRTVTLHGPMGRPVTVTFDDEWLGLATGAPVPLYVGKTADSLAKRLGLHLTLKRDRVLGVFEGDRKQERPTTSCQLRAGIDQLFPSRVSTRGVMLDNVGISYVVLSGDEHAVNRFYLEDLAIGMMRPPLNIDIER